MFNNYNTGGINPPVLFFFYLYIINMVYVNRLFPERGLIIDLLAQW